MSTLRVPHLRVAWHPDCAEGPGLADAIFRAFHLDPARPLDPSLDLPVAFGWRGEGQPPSPVPVHHTPSADQLPVLVLLVDDLMVAEQDVAFADAPGGLEGVISRWVGTTDRVFLPVSLSGHAFHLHPRVAAINYVRLEDLPALGHARSARLISRLTHELAREVLAARAALPAPGLRPAPVGLFLSHAKEDGDGIAGELLEYLARNSPVTAFYDSSGIAPGEDFAARLQVEVGHAVFVALHTDAWPTRPWCRWEARLARDHDLPFLLVEAGEQGGEESFPYPGAAPRIRWRGPTSCAAVVDAAIRVALRWELTRARLQARVAALGGPSKVLLVPHTPDLLDGLRAQRVVQSRTPVLLHPDPPMHPMDRDHFERHLPDVELLSQSELGGVSTRMPAGTLVQVSVSEPDDASLAAVGAGPRHVEAVQLAIARALLDRGASVAYGGDLREGGFTRLLFNLVEAANRRKNETQAVAPIETYVGWPLGLAYDRKVWAAFARTACRHVFPQPADPLIDLPQLSPDGKPFPSDRGPAERYAWSRGMTDMRMALAGPPVRNDDGRRPPKTDTGGKSLPVAGALVALGGRVGKFAGTVPGVLEEIVLSCRAHKPVFLCAGFGGATAVAAALLGLPAPITADAAQALLEELDITYAAAHAWAGPAHPLPSAQAMGQELRAYGDACTALGIQLSPEQHAELATTTDPDHIVRLVLAGLPSLPHAEHA